MAKKAKKKVKKESTKDNDKTEDIKLLEDDDNIVDDKDIKVSLINELKSLKSESYHEIKLINEAQQSKIKIEIFWNMAKQQREDLRMELRSKFRLRQDLLEKQHCEIKIYRQKVKHLLHEHQSDSSNQLIDSEVTLNLHQTANRQDESEAKNINKSLQVVVREKEIAQLDLIKDVKKLQEKEIMLLRQEFERLADETKQYYEKRLKAIRKDSSKQKKTEIKTIETRKNNHISKLMVKHKNEFNDIKNYFTNVTHNNLDLIRQLKDEVVEMRRKEHANEKEMNEIGMANKKLTDPLKRYLKDVEELRVELKSYNKDKLVLKQSKERVQLIEQNLKKLKWDYEIMNQHYETVKKDRNRLFNALERAVYENQQKSGFKELLLEKSLHAVHDSLEKKETTLHEVLLSANLQDQPNLPGKSLEIVLSEKSKEIDGLESELNRWRDKYNNMIKTYESKLEDFGIPPAEIGFQPRAM